MFSDSTRAPRLMNTLLYSSKFDAYIKEIFYSISWSVKAGAPPEDLAHSDKNKSTIETNR